MKRPYYPWIFMILIVISSLHVTAQVAINQSGAMPHASAGLDIDFSNKGFLLPRMTLQQISAITNPADGLLAYCTTDHKLCIYLADNLVWKEIGFGEGNIPPAFSCGNLLTDFRDGQTYQTVQVGAQCWMKENLNFGVKINGNVDQLNNGIAEKYCYDNLDANCESYGGLYQWAELVQYINGTTNNTTWGPVPVGNITGLCPDGWHVPADAEWTNLGLLFGGEISAGGALKESGIEHWGYPNAGATNSSGFTALPGGNRYNNINFGSLNVFAFLWTSTQKTSVNAWIRTMHTENEYLDQTYYGKSNGCAVRCVLN